MASMGRCRSCGEPIRWATTVKGRQVPLDVEPVDGGGVAWDPDDPDALAVVVADGAEVPEGARRWSSHLVTCRLGSAWRQREKDRRHGR